MGFPFIAKRDRKRQEKSKVFIGSLCASWQIVSHLRFYLHLTAQIWVNFLSLFSMLSLAFIINETFSPSHFLSLNYFPSRWLLCYLISIWLVGDETEWWGRGFKLSSSFYFIFSKRKNSFLFLFHFSCRQEIKSTKRERKCESVSVWRKKKVK